MSHECHVTCTCALCSALTQFFEVFTEYQTNDFYIAGEVGDVSFTVTCLAVSCMRANVVPCDTDTTPIVCTLNKNRHLTGIGAHVLASPHHGTIHPNPHLSASPLLPQTTSINPFPSLNSLLLVNSHLSTPSLNPHLSTPSFNPHLSTPSLNPHPSTPPPSPPRPPVVRW